MLRSLWVRLILAFAAVIAVMVLVLSLVVSATAKRELSRYIVNSGQVWTDLLASALAQQYSIDGGWQNAQQLLVSGDYGPPVTGSGNASSNGQGQGSGQGEGQGQGMMHQDMMHMPLLEGDQWWRVGLRPVVADPDGIVVADVDSSLIGQTFTAAQLAQGTPIMVNGVQVGTLLLILPTENAPLQSAFLDGTNRAILLAGLAAGAAALVVGTLLFVTIMRPLGALRRAAEQVASGNLTARVETPSNDEVGTVSRAFNQMAVQLDSQQHLRQQMVADIAHELRTPISILQGTLEAMIDGVLPATPQELGDLHDESQRLARLVEDLRTLSLADAGQLTLERGPVDIAELVDGVVSRMAPLADTRQITLKTEIAPNLPTVEADSDRLAQVLTNLINNAIRYTTVGGQVTVRLAAQGDTVDLAVEDNGPGVPPEDLPFLFERFWRGDKSRSRDSGGSGIGLAIVKQLVELHGGSVRAESAVGQGSAFHVTLPAGSAG